MDEEEITYWGEDGGYADDHNDKVQNVCSPSFEVGVIIFTYAKYSDAHKQIYEKEDTGDFLNYTPILILGTFRIKQWISLWNFHQA